MSYRCILADPPWPEYGGGRIKRGAQKHYSLMKLPAIEELMRRLLLDEHRAADNCHLWLWSTNNYLPAALDLMHQLTFRYISNVVWAKMKPYRAEQVRVARVLGTDYYQPQKPGLGQYLRGQHELLLFGVRGRLPAVQKGATLLPAARRKHSQKPEEAYELIERVSPGPRLEMFARGKREGWDSWGDEI